jgi:O-succinylbenzoic acid--CoA ligase
MTKGITQPDWLWAAAQEAPDALALIDGNTTWTYTRLNAEVDALCAALAADGAQLGERIGVLLPNSAHAIALIWAIWRLGATAVMLNTRLTADERSYQCAAADCTRIIDAHSSHPLSNSQPPIANRQYTRLATAVIMFTSGTSGRPKGVQLTFNNLYYAAMASTLRLGNQPEDRWLLSLPLYHIGGLSMLVRACLSRVPIIVLDRFEPQRILAACAQHHATLVSLVPTVLHRVLSAEFKVQSANQPTANNPHPIPNSLSPFPPSLRLLLIGGAAASPELIAQALARGIPVATTYGMTEAGSQVCTALPDEVRAKPGTVGKPLPFMRVRVVDEQGRDVPTGEYGEIVVAGLNVMWGYLGEQPDIPLTKWGTPARLPYQDGFRTGDIGYLDAEGDLFLVQRRSDLIITGGENVYPSEVERVLREHPSVADAVVVGVPDAEWGQRVAAVVAGKDFMQEIGEKEDRRGNVRTRFIAFDLAAALESFVRAHLAGYKVPRLWRFVDALPQTATGKVDRGAAAALFTDA